MSPIRKKCNTIHLPSSVGSILLMTWCILSVLLSEIPSNSVGIVNALHDHTILTCYLYSSNISDYGFTFGMNVARLKAHALFLRSTDLNYTIASMAVENFPSLKNRITVLEELITHDNCRVFFSLRGSNFAGLNMTDFSARYPHVPFISLESAKAETVPPQTSGMIYIGADVHKGWYQVGAVAGAQSQTCVGFILPYFTDSLAAFALYEGMKRHSPKTFVPKLVVTAIGSNYNPKLELLAAEQFAKRGCDVVVTSTDTRQPVLFAAKNVDLYPNLMTVGFNNDQQRYSGDTVLTSLVFDFSEVFVNMTKAVVSHQPVQGGFIVTPTLTTISSRARQETRAALTAAKQWLHSNPQKIFCHSLFANETNELGQSGCLSALAAAKSSVIQHPSVTMLQSMQDPAICLAGTYYSYDATGDMSLSCIPCPPKTHSKSAGSASCAPCPGSQLPTRDSTNCYEIVSEMDFPVWATILIFLLSLLLFIALGTCIGYLKRHQEAALVYPSGPNVAMCIVGIRPRQTQEWRSSLLVVCDMMTAIVSSAAERTGVFVSSVFGEIHVLAANDVQSLAKFVHQVQEDVNARDWPQDIVLKSVIHVGQPTITIKVLPDGREQPVYSGPDCNILRCMYKHAAPGKLWISVPTIACHLNCFVHIVEEARPLKMSSGQSISWMHISSIEVTEGGQTGAIRVNMQVKEEGREEDLSVLSKGPSVAPTVFNDNTSHSTLVYNKLRVDRGCANTSGDNDDEEEDDADREDVEMNTSTPSASSEEDENLMQFLSLSILSSVEFEAAHQFTSDILKSLLSLLSFEDQIHVLDTVCRRLKVPPPKVPQAVKKMRQTVRQPLFAVSFQLLHQMEELELLQLTEQWVNAAEHRMKTAEREQDLMEEEQETETASPPAVVKSSVDLIFSPAANTGGWKK